MATMDDLIEEMLTEYEPRFILDEPIPEAEERLLPRPLRLQWPFTDLDDRVSHPVSRGSRYLTTPKTNSRWMAPPRSSLHGGLKEKTRWPSAMSRLPTACVPEPAGWRWTLGWLTREWRSCLIAFWRASFF